MTDIVERLRERCLRSDDPLYSEAADEIERLRAKIENLRADNKRLRGPIAVADVSLPGRKEEPNAAS